jgi:hypothetical protein
MVGDKWLEALSKGRDYRPDDQALHEEACSTAERAKHLSK